MKMRKKWWQIANNSDEKDLFNLLARSKYSWRNVSSILKQLGWSNEKLQNIIDPYIKQKIILVKRTKNNDIQLGYWECVDADNNLGNNNTTESVNPARTAFDPNRI